MECACYYRAGAQSRFSRKVTSLSPANKSPSQAKFSRPYGHENVFERRRFGLRVDDFRDQHIGFGVIHQRIPRLDFRKFAHQNAAHLSRSVRNGNSLIRL